MSALSGTQHLLRAGDYEASIASVGASLRSLTHAGRDLVVPFAADQVRPAYRGATLVPWPNRVVDGRYCFGGAEHQLALTEPSRRHALHGLGVWLDFEAVDKGADNVELHAVIEAQSGYPWRLGVWTRFWLGPEGLRQTVRAENLSAEPAPFGTGPHPYLVAGPSPLDDWTLELPAASVFHTTEDRLLPTRLAPVDADDPARFDFRMPRPIGAAEIDHAFTGLSAHRVTVLDPTGTGVAIEWDAACPWVQVHTADLPGGGAGNRAGLAVEPMTCAPDAFNQARYDLDLGLVVIHPGETVEASWLIAAR
ncbi:aldose 1-epimerase family protein [Microbacterium sp. SORGH_AS_0888]|uniref:aldose 1-epimerase family protein n=1 Tax=Microbacterium sp. SORGH_AS_0888 TaxID=3041791 RepID=UPI00277F3A65|nr:aldose 1-epimerase family protein [Microbacterium sp. SORGH_AS_0888]MDQ1130517.1 aldose 1-epimerase [Microbacterium sp. SORGH_AS_0888]